MQLPVSRAARLDRPCRAEIDTAAAAGRSINGAVAAERERAIRTGAVGVLAVLEAGEIVQHRIGARLGDAEDGAAIERAAAELGAVDGPIGAENELALGPAAGKPKKIMQHHECAARRHAEDDARAV